jgi:hypothetical protein
VIAGDLSKIKKLDCAAAVDLARGEEASVSPDPDENVGGDGAGGAAGGSLVMPTLRARSLGAIPAGSLNIGRSILMVMTGCLGGAYYHDKLETSACGDDYAPRAPNLRPIVVTLSRAIAFGMVGLQGVHASPATGKVDVRVSGDQGMSTLVFASGIGFGKIAPRPADTRFSPEQLGVDQPNYGLQIVGDSGSVLYQAAWSDIYASSGIQTLVPARAYTAIVLGPDPLLEKRGFWNESKFALVDNDPTR